MINLKDFLLKEDYDDTFLNMIDLADSTINKLNVTEKAIRLIKSQSEDIIFNILKAHDVDPDYGKQQLLLFALHTYCQGKVDAFIEVSKEIGDDLK